MRRDGEHQTKNVRDGNTRKDMAIEAEDRERWRQMVHCGDP